MDNRYLERMLVALFVGSLASACSTDGSSPSPSGSDAGPPDGAAAGSLRVATFNAGLAPLDVPLAAERAPFVAEALAAAAPDVLCVQEYWQTTDFDALAARLKPILPYAFHRDPRPGSSTCGAAELRPRLLRVRQRPHRRRRPDRSHRSGDHGAGAAGRREGRRGDAVVPPASMSRCLREPSAAPSCQ